MPKGKFAIPVGFTLFFWWVTPHLIYDRNGDLFSGHPNVWGDWSAHFAYTAHFAFKPVSLWFTNNPIFVGGKLHYPFLFNLFSSLLVRTGVEIGAALQITSFLTMSGSVWLLYFFFRKVTGRGGLALGLIFLGGGLGWALYLRDLFTGGNLFDSLLFPPREYGHLHELGLAVGGALPCLWFPQRSLTLAVVASVPFFAVLASSEAPRREKQIACGLLAGLLPLIHVHTLLCVVVLLGCFVVEKRKTALAFLPTIFSFLGTAALCWVTYHHDSPGTSFLTFQPWWLAGNPGTAANRMGWIVFWIWNWSLFLPLVISTFVWVRPVRARFMVAAGALLFLVANFIRFQPWDWDNTKIFFWAYVFMIPAAIQALEKIAARKRGALIMGVALAVLLGTGFLDAMRFFSPHRTSFLFFSRAEQRWGKRLREAIPPTAVVLTSNDAHDWVVSLAGRQVVMGYPGWLWSYGLPGVEREQEVKAFFANLPGGEKFLEKYGVTHITLDQKMRTAYGVDEKRFAGFPEVWSEPGLTVYAVPSTPGGPPR